MHDRAMIIGQRQNMMASAVVAVGCFGCTIIVLKGGQGCLLSLVGCAGTVGSGIG